MNQLAGLKKQRSSCCAVLTKMTKYASHITEGSHETIEEMRVKLNRAQELLEKIIEIEGGIFALQKEEESKLIEAEESYYTIASKLNEWIRKRGLGDINRTINGDTTMNTSGANVRPGVKLAKLQVPTFSGDYTEWQRFFDLFSSSIHDKGSFPAAQKFQYLMGLLRGEAYAFVKHFRITEANYIEALQRLRQRCDRKRHTINAFIRTFLEQSSVNLATASNIRKLLDISDEVVRGLKALGDKAEAQDPWLIHILLKKTRR